MNETATFDKPVGDTTVATSICFAIYVDNVVVLCIVNGGTTVSPLCLSDAVGSKNMALKTSDLTEVFFVKLTARTLISVITIKRHLDPTC